MEGPRPPRREELDDLLGLLCEVWDFFPRAYSEEYLRSAIRRRLVRRDARVIVEDGEPVSNIQMLFHDISLYGCRFRTASIGCVCTRKDRRREGLAGAVLAQCLRDMAAAKARVLFVSGDRSLYRRNHCVRAGDFLSARLEPGSLPAMPAALTVRPLPADDWLPLAPLYQAEPVRFRRRTDFLSQTCFWWDCNKPAVWLVGSGGKALAYLVLMTGSDGGPEQPIPILSEYAGSRAAIADALPAIAEAGSFSAVNVAFPAHDRELAYLLGRLGVSLKHTTLPHHTIRLLDLPGLMRRLRPYAAARLDRADLRRLSFDQEGEVCRVTYEHETAEMSLSEAARLLFGGPDAPRLSGDLKRVADTIFPVPLPMIGLDYI